MVLRDAWTRQSLHAHRPLELIVALDGPIRLMAGDAEILSDCLLVPPMREHALLDYTGRMARLYLDTGYRRLTYWRDRPIVAQFSNQRDLMSSFDRFFGSNRTMEDAQALIGQWTASWVGPDEHAPPCDPRVAAVLRHLDEQTTSVDADRRSVATLVGLSPSRFAALFAADTGMSLRRYLNWRRVKIGAKLVCDGESLTNAAAQAGFADSGHFTRSCRAAYGYPPSHFQGFAILQSADALGSLDGTGEDGRDGKRRRSGDEAVSPHVCLAPFTGLGA